MFSALFDRAWKQGIAPALAAWERAYPSCFAARSVLSAIEEWLPEVPPDLLRCYRGVQAKIPHVMPALPDRPSKDDIRGARKAAIDEELSCTRDPDPMIRRLLALDLDRAVEEVRPRYAALIAEQLNSQPGQGLDPGILPAYRALLSGAPLPSDTAESFRLAGESKAAVRLRMAEAAEMALISVSKTGARREAEALMRRGGRRGAARGGRRV